MAEWKVEYKEVGSDKIRTTYHSGNKSKEYVVEFFGLDDANIEWYNVTEVEG